jgi:glycosyltransferase involved in cell wall biosynthesis
VLFLAGEYPPRPGGVGDYTALLAAHLAEQGVRVTVLASAEERPRGHDRPPQPPKPGGSPGDVAYSLRRVNVASSTQQHATSSRQHSVAVWRAVERWDWGCARTVLEAVRAVRPDVVHVQYQPAAFGMEAAVHWLPGWLRRRCPGVRAVTTFHDLRVPYLFPKAGRLRAVARDRLLHGSDAAIFTEWADWAAAPRGRPAARHWVPIGSNIAAAPPAGYDREQWRQAVGAEAGTLLIVHLGILNRSKGLDTLFGALLRLHGEGRRVRLLLIGAEAGASDPSNRAYAAEVDSRLADPALGALVHRLPLVPADEASGYLLAADVAAFSFVDGASLRRGSLLAALGHGLPTVSTGVGGQGRGVRGQETEMVGLGLGCDWPRLGDGEHLLLVPPGDARALAGALARVADDEALRARLAAGGRALVDALGWPRIAAAHRAIYARVLSAGRRTGRG